MKKNFKNFIATLNEELFTWGYFSDFKKVDKNVFEIKTLLNILNSLIGEEEIEDKFIGLLKEYPKTRSALLILIATRDKKIKELKILNTETLDSSSRWNLFDPEISLTSDMEIELKHFFVASGLKEVFVCSKIKDLTDYVFGIEVGMDTHARKNRSGDLMENLVYEVLEKFTEGNKQFHFIKQATAKKIREELNYEVEVNINDRIYDFALLDTRTNRLFILEVNLYGSGGTKLKSVAGEFEKVNNFVNNQKINFVWVTDGVGWKTAENPMLEAFNNNDYTFNLHQFNEFLESISK